MQTSGIFQESLMYIYRYMKMNLIILGIICIFNKILKNIFLRNFNVLSPNLFREGKYITFYVQHMKYILIMFMNSNQAYVCLLHIT